MKLRQATPADAAAMCAVLNPLIEAGGTTSFRTPFGPERMTEMFIAPPSLIACTLAVDEGAVLGFQILDRAHPNWTGPLDLPPDWAVIGSYVMKGQGKRGIGSRLFEATREAARKAAVPTIDATISRENAGGLAYYGRMGFVEYRGTETSVSKRYDLHSETA